VSVQIALESAADLLREKAGGGRREVQVWRLVMSSLKPSFSTFGMLLKSKDFLYIIIKDLMFNLYCFLSQVLILH